jgi:class 3 adenylate cyclase
MEPHIQYAKTADGVSIAFWTLGEGMPLVWMSSVPFNNIQLEWQLPGSRLLHEGLAQKRRLVRYDGRGLGLSERNAADFSLDAHASDLDAVVDRLSLDRFALLAFPGAGPAAIAYTGRHPERVSHLILIDAYARASDWTRIPQMKALGGLLGRDWETYTETYAHIAWGWSAGEQAGWWARLLRTTITHEAMQLLARSVREIDVTELLPLVRCPTLVLHRRDWRLLGVDTARELASQIPDARLVLVEGASEADWDVEAALRAIDEFLGEEEKATSAAAPAGLVTILFTDMEGSTTLTQRLGDAKAQEVLRAHNSIVRDALKACGGSEIKHTGDGIMASFPLASGALECAIAVQRAVAARAEEHPDMPLRVRIGLNAGEPVAEEQDLFGTAVQLAARICARAEPGQILVPTVVRELAAGKGFLLADLGEIALRGFEDPVRLYEVRWRESAGGG